MVRTSEAIKTHFFSAIRAFTQLELMRTEELIENWYEVQRNLSLQVARDFILEHLEQKMGLVVVGTNGIRHSIWPIQHRGGIGDCKGSCVYSPSSTIGSSVIILCVSRRTSNTSVWCSRKGLVGRVKVIWVLIS